MPIAQDIFDMIDIGRKPSVISGDFDIKYLLKIALIAKDICSCCAMALEYSFQLLSAALSHRVVAQWVHPFMQ